jgi:hypothetical protein
MGQRGNADHKMGQCRPQFGAEHIGNLDNVGGNSVDLFATAKKLLLSWKGLG